MDLRFKIIADYVAAGWDKSKAAVASLKGSMADFFRSSVGGWGKFAAGATAAFSAVLAGAKSLRDGVIRELERMEVQDVANTDWNQRFTRKAGKVSSQDEKNKLQEDVDKELRDTQMRFDQLQRREETQFPWEELKDAAERKINEAMGLGNKTDDERMLEQLGNRLTQLRNKAQFVRNLKVESRFESFQAEESAFTQEQIRVQDLENTTDALAKEKKAADALEVAMKDLDSAKAEFAKAPNDEAAETAVKRQFELVKKLTAEWKNASKEAEDYDPPATVSRKERANPWGSTMGGGIGEDVARNRGKRAGSRDPLDKEQKTPRKSSRVERDKRDRPIDMPEFDYGPSMGDSLEQKTPRKSSRVERDKRGRPIDMPEFDYGPSMGDSLTKSHVGGLAGRREGGFGSRGGHITRFSQPAFLERATAMREGKTGLDSDQNDPRLVEMKKQTDLLESIEKKTGAAP